MFIKFLFCELIVNVILLIICWRMIIFSSEIINSSICICIYRPICYSMMNHFSNLLSVEFSLQFSDWLKLLNLGNWIFFILLVLRFINAWSGGEKSVSCEGNYGIDHSCSLNLINVAWKLQIKLNIPVSLNSEIIFPFKI